jgi:O-antigen ligase
MTTTYAQRLYFLTIIVSVILLGSASANTLAVSMLLLGLTMVLAFANTRDYPDLTGLTLKLVACGVCIALWVLFQSLTFPNNPFANDMWTKLNSDLDGNVGSVSVDPGTTREAVLQLLSPLAIFLVGLRLFQRTEQAKALLLALAWFGLFVACFSLIQSLFFPGKILFFEKRFYLDSLTATFVNRNAAATFFGLALIVWLAKASDAARKLNTHTLLLRLMEIKIFPADKYGRFLGYCAASCILIVVLYMTKSRGGAIAACVASAFFLMTAVGIRHGYGIRFLFVASLPVFLFWIFGGNVLHRLLTVGLESRDCVYFSTLVAIQENPHTGTGLGTFEVLFPRFRGSNCGSISQTWLQAHNSWLEAMLTLGTIGFGLLLLPIAIIVWQLVLSSVRVQRYRLYAVAGLAAIILVAIHACIDFTLQTHGVAAYLAAILAALVSISLAGKRAFNHGLKLGEQAEMFSVNQIDVRQNEHEQKLSPSLLNLGF